MSEDEILGEEEYIVDVLASIERNLRSYSGFDSLIRELIQNSEGSADGQYVNVDICFNEDTLVLKNNTVFTEKDWERIRKIGYGNNENDSNRPGRFGIGFTSVFKICDTLAIHSKGVTKKLDLNTVKWKKFKPRYAENNITEFEFFWRTEDSNVRKQIHGDLVTLEKKEAYLEEIIESLDKDLYFLKNITRIRIYERKKLLKSIEIDRKSLDIGVNLCKEVRTIKINNNISTIYIYHYNLENKFSEEYASEIARNSSILLSIAFDSSNFEKGRIFCTLPTEMHTDSPLNINSDFQPDPNRKQILNKADDEKGQYNTKIFEFLSDLLYSIIDDLKSTLTIKSFYALLNSFLNNKTILGTYFQNFIDDLINFDLDIIFINDKWHCISDVKFSRNSTIIPFLERIEYPIISNEYYNCYSLFEKLGIKEFSLEDLISLIKENVPSENTPFKESIFESKGELISIFMYIKKYSENGILESDKEDIKGINIFLTADEKLINFSRGKFARYPPELEPLREYLPFRRLDKELLDTVKELLEELDIFVTISPKHIFERLITDFQTQKFPLDLRNSKPYLNSTAYLIKIINFLDPGLRILQHIKKGQQIPKDLIVKFENSEDKPSNKEFIDPFDPKYKQYEKLFLDNLKYLPLSLSQEGFLYPLENNKVFNLNSQVDKDFASKYQLVTIDPDIASILGSYGFVQELDLEHIFYYVKQECESATVLEKDSLLLLYKVMVEKKNQLIDNVEIKSLIESLPIFIDNKRKICSLKGEQEEVFLQGPFVDYTGTARILDNEIIDSVEDFKKSILIGHFEIKALSFKSFVENYFEKIFNELNIDTGIKLKLIEDFSKSIPKSEKVQKTLQNTKFIYCSDKKFHSPEEKDIFHLNTTNKETFALKHNLLIMDANVKTIVSQYQFLNELELDRIIDYVCIDIEKGSILTDSDLVLLYKLIFEERKSLSNEELNSKIRKLPIFKNSRGDLCALENNGKEMVLLGNYKDPIGVNEILSNDLTRKVNNFNECILKKYFKIKNLSFKLFVERYFEEIFNDDSIEKSKKLELLKELNKKFIELTNNANFDINVLKKIKLVYCQDGNFYMPNHENLFFKNNLIDKVFGDDYLYPCLDDFEDYKHMYEKLGVRDELSSREIINYIEKITFTREVNLELINKMRAIFISINDYLSSSGEKAQDFSELAEIKWLPAVGDYKTLYKPSSLFTQYKGQNTRLYLLYLDNILYLDVTDKHLLKANLNYNFINILGLKIINKIPTALIIDNIEKASNKNKPLKNHLGIYKEINTRIDKSNNSWVQDVDRLNNFPSIYINNTKGGSFSYFEPTKVFRNGYTKLYGNEYIGYLSPSFVVHCEKLLNHLKVSEEPNCLAIKRILEDISNKYERSDNKILSEEDKKILINCLRKLNKISDFNLEPNFILELQNLYLLYNNEDKLLKPNMAIVEDNLSLADQFREGLNTYFVIKNPEYLNLISRLEMKKLSKLVKKKLESKPDVSLLKINKDYTFKVRWIYELLTRIKAENRHLDEFEWAEIDPEIKAYQFDDLSVLKYVVWNGEEYKSSNNKINCYIEKKDDKFSNIYVKGSDEEIHQSLSEELFEEIHPNINKDFKAVIYALLTKNSQKDMEDYLDFVNYVHIEEPSDTFLEGKEEIDNDVSDESEESLNEENYERHEYTDSWKDNIEINDNKERELNSKTEELVSAEWDIHKVNAPGILSSNSFDGETINNDFQQAYKTKNNVDSHLKNGEPNNFTSEQSEVKNTNLSTENGFEKEKVERKYAESDHKDNITEMKSPDGLRVASENPYVFSVSSNDFTSEADDISKESHTEVENISREDYGLETDKILEVNKTSRDGRIKNESLPHNKENRIPEANDKKLNQEPSDVDSPIIEWDAKRNINFIETPERSAELSHWIRGLYGYHCQICLAEENPALLTYPKSYASYDVNRKYLMHAHHIKAVTKEGHDHPGNYLSLCEHHHEHIHKIELTVNKLDKALKSVTKKEITWPDGRKFNWNLLTFEDITKEDNAPLKLVIREEHLEQIKKYMKHLSNYSQHL